MTDKLLQELASVGYALDSVSDLRSSGLRYREAIPVLLRFLELAEDAATREEIVRALSVPWAKSEALDPLIQAFRDVPRTGVREDLLRWAIGNALEVIWDDSRYDDLAALVTDTSFGMARQMVVLGMAKSKRVEAGEVLVQLLKDPDVNGHAVSALKKLKFQPAREGLELMLNDSRAWVRKEAKRALDALR